MSTPFDIKMEQAKKCHRKNGTGRKWHRKNGTGKNITGKKAWKKMAGKNGTRKKWHQINRCGHQIKGLVPGVLCWYLHLHTTRNHESICTRIQPTNQTWSKIFSVKVMTLSISKLCM